MKYFYGLTLILIGLFSACDIPQKTVPILGKIKQPFEFINQDGERINEQLVKNKIYVTDFFFTTCPTICPKMKAQMLRVHEKFKDRTDVILLSHSIDPKDSVEVLRDYAARLEVKSEDWQFVTGDRNQIFSMAKAYMITAGVDANAPGGYIHSGALVLLDKKRRVRGYYDGTKAEETDDLIRDINRILNERK
ncbi:MAG: SCO family protein [Flammeovirgaceae bacterium]